MVTSPARRARETALHIAGRVDCVADEMGPADDVLQPVVPRPWTWRVFLEGGCGPAAGFLARRVLGALEGIVAPSSGGAAVLVITYDGVVQSLARALGPPPGLDDRMKDRLDFCEGIRMVASPAWQATQPATSV